MEHARESMRQPLSHSEKSQSRGREGGVAEQWLNNWQDIIENNIEKTADKLVENIESASHEIGRIMDSQLSKRPWTYLSACVGGGIVLGFLLSRVRQNSNR